MFYLNIESSQFISISTFAWIRNNSFFYPHLHGYVIIVFSTFHYNLISVIEVVISKVLVSLALNCETKLP